jgi:hypothetical protein
MTSAGCTRPSSTVDDQGRQSAEPIRFRLRQITARRVDDLGTKAGTHIPA